MDDWDEIDGEGAEPGCLPFAAVERGLRPTADLWFRRRHARAMLSYVAKLARSEGGWIHVLPFVRAARVQAEALGRPLATLLSAVPRMLVPAEWSTLDNPRRLERVPAAPAVRVMTLHASARRVLA